MWTVVFSETTTGCFPTSRDYYGMVFWTAGQRIDPSSNSAFVWRVASTNTYSDTVSLMTYTNWEPGQPSYWQQNESCMHFSSKLFYQWNDCPCLDRFFCSVCEIDILPWARKPRTHICASKRHFEYFSEILDAAIDSSSNNQQATVSVRSL